MKIHALIRAWAIAGPLFLIAASAYGSSPGLSWSPFNTLAVKSEDSPISPQLFQQALDHDSLKDKRTFAQRFYVDDRWADGTDSPVLFVICGEQECTPHQLGGAVQDLAKKQHAWIVGLEHRYYGQSLPFDQLTVAHLAYLSTHQALEDLAAFQKWITGKLGLTGPWVVVGGSYAGALSAFYREKHPELVVGALASSAPVMATLDFSAFDKHIAGVLGPDCAQAVRDLNDQIASFVQDPKNFAKMKSLFGADEIQDRDDFLYYVTDQGTTTTVQYGEPDKLCDIMEESDPIEDYAKLTQEQTKEFDMAPVQDTFQGVMDTDKSSPAVTSGMRQWLYQSCKEYGFWQTAYQSDDALRTRPASLNLDYFQKGCEKVFGLTSPAQTDEMRRTYYEPLLKQSSNIFFVNGSNDPWSELSIDSIAGNNVNPKTPVYLVDGGSHCSDLHSADPDDTDSLTKARDEFEQWFVKWTANP